MTDSIHIAIAAPPLVTAGLTEILRTDHLQMHTWEPGAESPTVLVAWCRECTPESFARDLAAASDCPVLVIALRQFESATPLIESGGKYVRFVDHCITPDTLRAHVLQLAGIGARAVARVS